MSCRVPFQLTGGDSRHHPAVRDVANDHGACADNCASADPDTLAYGCACADMGGFSNDYSARQLRARGDVDVIAHPTVMLDDGARIDQHIDPEPGARVDDGTRQDLTPRAELRGWSNISRGMKNRQGGKPVFKAGGEDSAAGGIVPGGPDPGDKTVRSLVDKAGQLPFVSENGDSQNIRSPEAGIEVEDGPGYVQPGHAQGFDQDGGMPAPSQNNREAIGR
ncbi:MAG TPA: hypothetical protein PKH31_04255 [Candidatus Sumerlaeota bacterium]|nr:hypothetical protein [Candidatus Sumerlaeota bacterium]